MTINSEFHANLQAGKVSEAISLVVGKLVEMDIVTNLPSGTDAAPPHQVTTKINLLSGLIVNDIGAEFISNPAYEKFLDFHTAQIDATSQLVREQLHGLQGLLHHSPPEAPLDNASLMRDGTISIVDGAGEAPLGQTQPAPEKIESLPADQPTSELETLTLEELKKPESTAVAIEPPTATVASITIERIEPVVSPSSHQPTPTPAPSATIAAEPSTAPEVPPLADRKVSGVSEAIALAGSPDPSEADTIPNKLNQVLKFAGGKAEEDEEHPFATEPTAITEPSPTTIPEPHPPANLDHELINLLNEPDEQWDEWLLEEDSIFSELSQASQAVTKEKIPDIDDNWFAQPNPKSEEDIIEDWEKFIPEYSEPDVSNSKSQANVERFRQNLVNDPQMMNELLAELDDIEQLSEGRIKSNRHE